jgi:hypothetical protein
MVVMAGMEMLGGGSASRPVALKRIGTTLATPRPIMAKPASETFPGRKIATKYPSPTSSAP